jgi:stearoyl-CoA desaturase (delta-9 desaturase)
MIYILLFFVAHWYLSLFSQTFFLHRYAAHGMFSMSKGWEKFFYLFTWVTQGSSYLSPYAYGAMHRMHHAYADTENDPHSPEFDPDFFTMMLRTRKVYNGIFDKDLPIEEHFMKNLPNWRSFDLFASFNGTRLAWIVAYTLFYVAFAPYWWLYLLIPVHALMGPVHGVIINWFAHKYGYRNFKIQDTSANLWPWDLLMMGEGLHNNHHKYGNRPNFGVRKWEFDPTYPVIRFLDWVNVIQLKKPKPPVDRTDRKPVPAPVDAL